jgi:NAD(P)H-dependent flavin oxidoreductase YrpB (nitropropane dioxygenase family)
MSYAVAVPSIIQGGMGVGVSGWRLARAVSSYGHLGVVSGTGLDTLFVRRLQDGDPGGDLRRAMARFPLPGVAETVLERYFRPEGRARGEPYDLLPMYKQVMDQARHRLTALANFVEVYLAREGHDGVVGLNLLTKVQLPNLASLYGAMLAGVDYVLMGAGIPREIPGVLDRLSRHEAVETTLEVAGLSGGEREALRFDPSAVCETTLPELGRPSFLPVVASHSLATVLARKANGRVDGFVVEAPTAGGHNAPPRGPRELNARGEPMYGARDEVDLAKMAELGVPFWLAGGAGHPAALDEARAAGAAGVQVGTLFAYCRESGLTEAHKRSVIEASHRGSVDVLTDERASPTGFPFKTVQLDHTLAEDAVYEGRERRCDLGYLRAPYRDARGRVAYRCPAEPVATFLTKGGAPEEAAGRKCLCNALMANVGHGQALDGGTMEPELFTAGDDLRDLGRFLAGRSSYSAADVIDYLMTTV